MRNVAILVTACLAIMLVTVAPQNHGSTPKKPEPITITSLDVHRSLTSGEETLVLLCKNASSITIYNLEVMCEVAYEDGATERLLLSANGKAVLAGEELELSYPLRDTSNGSVQALVYKYRTVSTQENSTHTGIFDGVEPIQYDLTHSFDNLKELSVKLETSPTHVVEGPNDDGEKSNEELDVSSAGRQIGKGVYEIGRDIPPGTYKFFGCTPSYLHMYKPGMFS